jgi:hypothetical protein
MLRKLGLTATGLLCILTFLISVDIPFFMGFGYLFGIVFIILLEVRPNEPSKKD